MSTTTNIFMQKQENITFWFINDDDHEILVPCLHTQSIDVHEALTKNSEF